MIGDNLITFRQLKLEDVRAFRPNAQESDSECILRPLNAVPRASEKTSTRSTLHAMYMIPFHTRFPDLAITEMRTATVRGDPGLPDGEYGFFEHYCSKSSCDCRRVIITVVRPTTGPTAWATITYGWESSEFYARWLKEDAMAGELAGASLEILGKQTSYSESLLELFELVVRDPAYVERLKRHYAMFKAAPESAVEKRRNVRDLVRRRRTRGR